MDKIYRLYRDDGLTSEGFGERYRPQTKGQRGETPVAPVASIFP